MKEWIYFNNKYIRSSSITVFDKDSNAIEIFVDGWSFLKTYNSDAEYQAALNTLLVDLGIKKPDGVSHEVFNGGCKL